MENVSFAHYNEENGWRTEDIELTGNIVLLVSLSKEGCVVIKKRNGVNEPNPKVYIKNGVKNLELTIYKEKEGMLLQVLTSTEPTSIRYANI